MGDNNYLPFQKTNKYIKKYFQNRHQMNFWSVRNVQKSIGECNTILSAYTLYRHLG